MVEIIPAILAASEEEFREKIGRLGKLPKSIQIDVMDGVFVKNRTWADPEVIARMHLPYAIEAHLMVVEPEKVVESWIAASARRIFVHAEAGGWLAAIKAVRAAGREAGVAINPATPLEVIDDVVNELAAVLVMGVTPGRSGQPLQRIAIARISELRLRYPRLRIEVDGGVALENAAELSTAGADALVAASALFMAKNFNEVFSALTQAATL